MTSLILPRFASDDASADIVEPSESLKDTGWVGGASPDRPAAQHMNWLMRKSYDAHASWRSAIMYAASDAWTLQNCAYSGTVNVTVQGLLVVNHLDLILSCGWLDSGLNGHISSAPNPGTTWTQRLSLGANTALRDFATDGTTVCCVGGMLTVAPIIYSSTNGTSWTDQSAQLAGGEDDGFRSITYDPVNGLWIACTMGEEIYTTTDPTSVTWVKRHDLGLSSDLFDDMATNPHTGKTLTIGGTSTAARVYSTNGTSWSTYTLPTGSANAKAITVFNIDGENVWVIVGAVSTNGAAWYSTDDGATWNAMLVGGGYPFSTMDLRSVGYSPALKHWLFMGRTGGSGEPVLLAGDLGAPESWSARTFPTADFTDLTDISDPVPLLWCDLEANPVDQYWVTGVAADSDESIILSSNPIL